MITAGVLWAVIPLSAEVIFNRGLFAPGGPDVGLVAWLTLAIGWLAVAAAGIETAHRYLSARLGLQVVQDLRDSMYSHLQRMPLGFFSATRTGEIQSRLSNDISQIQQAVGETAPLVLAEAASGLTAIGAMVALSWKLALVSVVMLPVLGWLSRLVSIQQRKAITAIQQGRAELAVLAEETLSPHGALLTKVFGQQEHNLQRFRKNSTALSTAQLRSLASWNVLSSVQLALFAVAPTVTYLIAALTGRLSAGVLVAFTALQFRLFQPVTQILVVYAAVRSTMPVFGRIFRYLDLPPAVPDRPGAVPLPRTGVRGEIEMTAVCFAHPGRDPGRPGQRPALQDISLRIPAGQFTAIVGPSGSGKTTLSLLIPRLYEPTSGTVCIDGRDVRDLTGASLADVIGFVTQDTCLFHASVADNLRYARPGATARELEAACRAAQIHDRICELPGGYDASVGERGQVLSGGERQRLAIARAILKDPPILILDEATSALDTASEAMVRAALQTLMSGRTTIAIAHRVSSVQHADAIIVLAHGRLVEQGTHDDLMAMDGVYARQIAQRKSQPAGAALAPG